MPNSQGIVKALSKVGIDTFTGLHVPAGENWEVYIYGQREMRAGRAGGGKQAAGGQAGGGVWAGYTLAGAGAGKQEWRAGRWASGRSDGRAVRVRVLYNTRAP